jgi:hypothetical protein
MYVIIALTLSLISFSLYLIFDVNKKSAVLIFISTFVLAQFFSVFYKTYMNHQGGR